MSFPARTLETVGLGKAYPGTVALHDFSMVFDGGKIHAVLGKNGAGKSTLVKLLSGAVPPSSGRIRIDGHDVMFRSPREALEQGIAAVHQELTILLDLTVAENILLHHHRKGRYGFIDWAATYRQAESLVADFGVDLDVHAKASTLGIALQQLAEIARAMSHNPAVLILDEPTSALASHETDCLFGLLKRLAARGVVILYITHRLEEIHRVADTVTVLRDGALVNTIGISQATPAIIVNMIFGEVIRAHGPPGAHGAGETVLEVRDFTRRGSFTDVSFTLHKGEILGIAGVLGAGRTELLRSLFGADPYDSGSLIFLGKRVHPSSPEQMKNLGMGLAPENRRDQGLVQILSTRANLCMASLHRIAGFGFTTSGRERAVAERNVRDIDIKVPSLEASVSVLSGGNQQKVVLAKWLNTGPRVILLDEPTRGIDMRAKQQLFQIVKDLSARGISSIVVSSELEELMGLCHRILIMKKGRILGEVHPQTSTPKELFALCMQ